MYLLLSLPGKQLPTSQLKSLLLFSTPVQLIINQVIITITETENQINIAQAYRTVVVCCLMGTYTEFYTG